MPNIINLIGQRFGRLVVLDTPPFRDRGARRTFYSLRCDCGNNTRVDSHSLRRGTTKSCGCLARGASRSAIMTKPNGAAACRVKWWGYKNGAKQRGLVFDVSYPFFQAITKKNCHYCDTPPFAIARNKHTSSYVYNGLDRLDNAQGYLESNVVPCCKICNWMKSNLSFDEFLAHIRKINRNLGLGFNVPTQTV